MSAMNLDLRLRQPKALYLLFFVQMWECFSYYGMRALLVLYLIEGLEVSEYRAIGIFSLYCALIELGGIMGGRLADKYLGLRPAIMIGGWLIALGHMSLLFEQSLNALYMSLGLIALGTSLFSTNISTLLGLFYDQEDPRREKGYTLFYMGINLGGLLATLSCAWVAELYGWHYGFGLAALGMVAGNLVLLAFSRLLGDKGVQPIEKGNVLKCVLFVLGALVILTLMMKYSDQFLSLLPAVCLSAILYALAIFYQSGKVSLKEIGVKAAFLLALAVYFSAEEQVATSLIVLSERYTTGVVAGLHIPSSILLSINPFIIIGGGAFIMMLCDVLRLQGGVRIAIGCLLGATAFILLSVSAFGSAQAQSLSMMPIILAVFLVALGELFVAPAICAYFSETAPAHLQGLTMGLIPIGYSLASVINGLMSQLMVANENSTRSESLEMYGYGFGMIAAVLISVSILLIFLQKTIRVELYEST